MTDLQQVLDEIALDAAMAADRLKKIDGATMDELFGGGSQRSIGRIALGIVRYAGFYTIPGTPVPMHTEGVVLPNRPKAQCKYKIYPGSSGRCC